MFTVEGLLALEQLVASPFEVESVLVAAGRWERVAPLVTGVEAPCLIASPTLLEQVAGFDVHRGVLALGRRRDDGDPAELLARLAPDRPVIVTEAVGDHENVGALFRNAAALGAAAVLGDPATADPFYRRAIRVSLGHVLRVPWARLRTWPGDLDLLRQPGRTVLALTPDPGARPLEDVARRRPRSFALLVGAEGSGLTAAAMGAADERVRIPLVAGVDSLNVATAAAVALYRLGAPEGRRTAWPLPRRGRPGWPR